MLQVRRGSVRQVGVIEEAQPNGEAGLLGVAVSPTTRRTSAVLLRHHRRRQPGRCARTFDGGRLGPLERSSTASRKAHPRRRPAGFGPDGYLYASTGETGEPDLAQDRGSLGGKILRITTGRRARRPATRRRLPGLVVRAPQRPGAGLRRRRPAVGLGVRAGHVRRAQPDRAGPQLRLADGRGQGRRATGLIDPQVVWRTDVASPSGLAYARRAPVAGRAERRAAVAGRRQPATGPAPEGLLRRRYGRMRTVVVAPDGNLWVTTPTATAAATRPTRTTGSCSSGPEGTLVHRGRTTVRRAVARRRDAGWSAPPGRARRAPRGGDRAAGVPARRSRSAACRRANRCRFSISGSPGTKDSDALVAGHLDAQRERPAGEVHQQPEGVRRDDAVGHQHRDLGSPVTRRGSSPAPIPTQAEASIWKGSHGPTPAVISAEANSEVQPEHEAEARRRRPGRRGSAGRRPARCRPCRRRAPRITALMAVSTPSIARTLESIPPSVNSARHDHDHHRQQQQEDERRLIHLALGADADQQRPAEHQQPGERGHGQHRGRPGPDRDGAAARRGAGVGRAAACHRPLQRPRPRRRVSHGGAEDLGDLRGERRRLRHDARGRARRRRPRPRRARRLGRPPAATNSTSWVATSTA